MDTTEQRLDPRRRELHPEQIVVGDETFIRNDKMAERHGVSERTVNRGDRDGAPYRFFGGVKYRPRSRYEQFILNSIREGKPRAPKRKQRSTQRADRAIQK
jgi:hypothetical protein